MSYLLGLIGLLLGGFGYNYIKRKSVESLLLNNDTKSKLNDQDKNKAKNDGLLEAEEEKRENLKHNTKKDKPVSSEDF